MSNEQVVKAITSESQNKLAPSNYTHFFEQVANIIDSQKELIKKQKTLNDSNAHSFKTVETNFHSLRALYEEEHERCLDLEERNINDRLKHDAAIQHLQEQLAEKINLEKQEHKKAVEKQAMVRIRMEQELVQNMKEAEELKQKLKEAEVKTAALEKALSDRNQYQLLQQQLQERGVHMTAATVAGGNAAAAGANNNMNGNNNAGLDFMRYF